MYLHVHFCGTGENVQDFLTVSNFDYLSQNPQVSTLYVNGCHDQEVCNAVINPNLNKFAKRFMKAFELIEEGPNKGKLKLKGDLNTIRGLGIGITEFSTVRGQNPDDFIIDDITLTGFSRGGVTCFEVARELQRLESKGKKKADGFTPVDIIAAEPVPGNAYNGPGTNAHSIADCSDLRNLRQTSIILGAYTSERFDEEDKSKGRSLYHRGFFSQIVPKLPFLTKKTLIITPRASHFDVRYNMPSSINHMHLQLAQYSLEKHLVSEQTLALKKHEVELPYKRYNYTLSPMVTEDKDIQWLKLYAEVKGDRIHYKTRVHSIDPKNRSGEVVEGFIPLRELNISSNLPPNQAQEELKNKFDHVLIKASRAGHILKYGELVAFTHDEKKLQRIYGLKARDVYKYLDQSHPGWNLPWDAQTQSLETWWNKHDEAISKAPSKLTKDLIETIYIADKADKASLIEVYKKADLWLLKKADSSSSRYYQVECLRNHVRDHLIAKDPLIKPKLDEINRASLTSTDYFRKHWQKASRAASLLETAETKKLNEAFFKHSLPPPQREKDQQLKIALEKWLDLKKDTKSKRIDLVCEMIERIDEKIKGYPEEVKKEVKNEQTAGLSQPRNLEPRTW